MKSFSKKYIKFALIVFSIGIIISITAYSFGGKIVNLRTHNVTNISESYLGVESLNIELGLSNIEVKTGNEFKIVANNVSSTTFKSYVKDGEWYIQDKDQSNFFDIGNYDSKVTIYVPESFKSDNLKINIGAGSLIADKFTAASTDINVGAGNLEISSFIADEVNIDCGVGNIEINGKINNKGYIKCGIGNVSLNLKGNEKDYNYDIKLGIGEVVLNGNDFGGLGNKVVENTSADKLFKIDCGIGKVYLSIN